MHTVIAAFLAPEESERSIRQRALALPRRAVVNKNVRLWNHFETGARLLDAAGFGFEHQVDQQDVHYYEQDPHGD